MNIYRFFGFPNAFKIFEFLLTILLILTVGFSDGTHKGSWFLWLNLVFQLLSLVLIIVAFLMEIENALTCGRDLWPLFEMGYSALFFLFNVINTFLCASWVSETSTAVAAGAFFAFILLLLYSLGGIMMFRIWVGVSTTPAPETAHQSATTPVPAPGHNSATVAPGTVLPDDTGNIHPGV